MKQLVFAISMVALSAPALHAGSPKAPQLEPEVIAAEAVGSSSSAGVLPILVFIAVVIAALHSSSGTSGGGGGRDIITVVE